MQAASPRWVRRPVAASGGSAAPAHPTHRRTYNPNREEARSLPRLLLAIPPDEGLVRVLEQVERAKYLVDRFDRPPEPPAGRRAHPDRP